MNFILSLVALSFLAVAFAAPEPFDDLRFEVLTLTNMVTEQQSQLASLKAEVGNRCQAGTVGSRWYPGIENSYPREYQIRFNPPFKAKPKFTYGITYLDSDATVRVDVRLKSLSECHATIEASSWQTRFLYAVQVRWMACP